MKNKKMNLKSLKISSFVTGIPSRGETVKGGAPNTLMNCSQRCTNHDGVCSGLQLCM